MNIRKHIILFVLILSPLLLTSCTAEQVGKVVKALLEPEPIDSTKPTKGRISLLPSHNTEEEALVVKLEKKFKWFVVEDCNGDTTREKRVIQEPREKIRLIAVSDKPGIFESSDIYNDETDDWRECTYNNCPKNDFDIHTSEWGAQAMHVDRRHINKIEYTLVWQDGFEESGTRYIEIEYSESTTTEEGSSCSCHEGCR